MFSMYVRGQRFRVGMQLLVTPTAFINKRRRTDVEIVRSLMFDVLLFAAFGQFIRHHKTTSSSRLGLFSEGIELMNPISDIEFFRINHPSSYIEIIVCTLKKLLRWFKA